MDHIHIKNASEQVAEHLRGRLAVWRKNDHVPGVIRLAKELGVGKDTVEAALRQLEAEGLLKPQGRRKRRKVGDGDGCLNSVKRFAILDYDKPGQNSHWVRDLHDDLARNGLKIEFAEQSLLQLEMNPIKVDRMLRSNDASAWIVGAATKNILEIFTRKGLPVLSLCGQANELPIASFNVRMNVGLEKVMEHLFELKHQRICLISRSYLRSSRSESLQTGFERVMLEMLNARGIATGSYNLPSWKYDDTGDFYRMLDTLFSYTPPTALLIDEVGLYIAVQNFLLSRGLKVPEDVSLVCTECDPYLDWCQPTVSRISWDQKEVRDSVRRWARNVEKGIEDTGKHFAECMYVRGGTVARAKVVNQNRPLVSGAH